MEVSLCEFEADQFPRGEERRETKTSVLVGREVGEEYNYYEVRRKHVGSELSSGSEFELG